MFEESKKKVLIIAHRGESHDAPENSLSSIKLAWERGADAVEVDVRLTLDGEIVLHHDVSTKRTGDKKLKIAESYIEHLLGVDIGSFKGKEWRNERIPTLQEALSTLPLGKFLLVELKSGEEIIQPLLKFLSANNVTPSQMRFIGFNFNLLANLKAELPEFEFYYLRRNILPFPLVNIGKIIAQCRESNIDGLNLHFKLLRKREVLEKIKRSGLKLFTWTVNDLQTAKRLVEWGVDGITTDKAGWLKRELLGESCEEKTT